MLSGLIFATEDADDRPDTLAATLPFGGSTLIEYQARLLAAVGVGHVLVAVSRTTPALLGATSRIAARGMTVDVVRSAEDAAAKVHPLAQVIVVADGLVTTDAVIEWMASGHQEVLLVTRDGDVEAGGSVERVDSAHLWAGLARVPARRLAEVATMPADYDFQSTLLRHSVQAGAEHLLLPAATARTRHGVERDGGALLQRSRSVLAALGDRRTAWVDRYLFTPVTGWTLPQLVARGIAGWGLIVAAVAAIAGTVAFYALAMPSLALVLTIVAISVLSTGSMLSWLRGEDRAARFQERAIPALAALSALALGVWSLRASGAATGLALALCGIAAVVLADRVPAPRRRWSGTPAAYPLVLLLPTLAGSATIGLALATAYAFLTLGSGIEAVREEA
ncbi:hypothetical protein [Sphingomonas sp. RS2018]